MQVIKREINKFSKRINNSEKAFYNPILILITTQLIFPHQEVATSHLPNPNQIEKHPNYSGQRRL